MVNEDDWDELAGRLEKVANPGKAASSARRLNVLMTNINGRSRMNFSAA